MVHLIAPVWYGIFLECVDHSVYFLPSVVSCLVYQGCFVVFSTAAKPE